MGNSESSNEKKQSAPSTSTTPLTTQTQPVKSSNASEDSVDLALSKQKNTDCYFYYYSACSKGDSCGFRHEPSALGCEKVCLFWKKGKCSNTNCNFRHMELGKNRKAIPCYWESQPGGCLKQHCPFKHRGSRPDGNQCSTNTPTMNINSKKAKKESENDPLVVTPFAKPIAARTHSSSKSFSQEYPTRDHSPMDYPSRDYAPCDYSPSEYYYPSRDSPPWDSPPMDFPPRFYPSRDSPPRDYPRRGFPPRDHYQRDYPPRGYPPFRDYYPPSQRE